MYIENLKGAVLSLVQEQQQKQLRRKLNKRAQRALGRSPEEKVKGQGEAIYRGPQMLSTKYW